MRRCARRHAFPGPQEISRCQMRHKLALTVALAILMATVGRGEHRRGRVDRQVRNRRQRLRSAHHADRPAPPVVAPGTPIGGGNVQPAPPLSGTINGAPGAAERERRDRLEQRADCADPLGRRQPGQPRRAAPPRPPSPRSAPPPSASPTSSSTSSRSRPSCCRSTRPAAPSTAFPGRCSPRSTRSRPPSAPTSTSPPPARWAGCSSSPRPGRPTGSTPTATAARTPTTRSTRSAPRPAT